MFPSWQAFYQSDLQSVYALWVVPLVFLLYWLFSRPSGDRAVEPRAISFLNVYAPLFVVETVLDPFATGPLARTLGLEEPYSTYWMLPFVLLGDFRVYLLVFRLLAPEHRVGSVVLRAVAWTLVVPIVALTATRIVTSYYAAAPAQTIWIAYETAFFVVAVYLTYKLIPSIVDSRRFELLEYLQALTRYVALYYALWAIADLLIVVGGYDSGWGLRALANQLYYSFWIPAAYFWFFSARYAATRRPVHLSR